MTRILNRLDADEQKQRMDRGTSEAWLSTKPVLGPSTTAGSRRCSFGYSLQKPVPEWVPSEHQDIRRQPEDQFAEDRAGSRLELMEDMRTAGSSNSESGHKRRGNKQEKGQLSRPEWQTNGLKTQSSIQTEVWKDWNKAKYIFTLRRPGNRILLLFLEWKRCIIGLLSGTPYRVLEGIQTEVGSPPTHTHTHPDYSHVILRRGSIFLSYIHLYQFAWHFTFHMRKDTNLQSTITCSQRMTSHLHECVQSPAHSAWHHICTEDSYLLTVHVTTFAQSKVTCSKQSINSVQNTCIYKMA